jgi:putative tryptophan/tyrosine transport system substrate-binding protein
MNRFVNPFSRFPATPAQDTAAAPTRRRMAEGRGAVCEGLNRRRLVGGLLLGAAGLPHRGQAQSQAPPLVGVLVSTGLHALDYLRQGLRELGFVEGKDVAFAFRSADGNPRDLPGLARHLAGLKPAVLFCAGPAALDAAVHATSSVPIVALDLETDPLRSGLVRSVEHPRTNVTGLFLDQPAIAARWFELLRQVLPQAQRVNLLWDASTGPWQLAAAKAAAQKQRFDADTLVVRDESEFERELADGLGRKPQALLLLSSPLVRARSKAIAEFCMRHRLPALSPFNEFPQAGGLMSYGPDVKDFYLRTAVFVERILTGAHAGDLPLSLPTQFRQVLNLRAAEQLGLVLPPALLAAASEVLR